FLCLPNLVSSRRRTRSLWNGSTQGTEARAKSCARSRSRVPSSQTNPNKLDRAHGRRKQVVRRKLFIHRSLCSRSVQSDCASLQRRFAKGRPEKNVLQSLKATCAAHQLRNVRW